MSFLYLGFGLFLLILDRVLKKGKMVPINERLFHFIHYYHPHVRRKHFLFILLLVSVSAIAWDYAINQQLAFSDYLVMSMIIFAIPYLAILFVSIFNYLLSGGDFALNFFRLEMELMENLALLFLVPLFALAQAARILLGLFLYPFGGLWWFHSFAGPLGLVLAGRGVFGLLWPYLTAGRAC